jgi:glycine cleavage system H lipoate-binding protein
MVLVLVFATLMIIATVGAFHYFREKAHVRLLATNGAYFHKGHAWVNFQESGLAKIGIDKFLRNVLGKFDEILVPSKGRVFKQGQVLMTISREGKDVNIVSPIDGVVVGTNFKPSDEKAFENDHLLVIRPTHSYNNIASMKESKEAELWIKSEFVRFKDFVVAHMTPSEVGLTMADGGKHVDEIITHMDKATLKVFNEEFLRS